MIIRTLVLSLFCSPALACILCDGVPHPNFAAARNTALAAIAGGPGSNTKSLVLGIDGLGYTGQGLGHTPTPVIDSLIDGSWAPGYRSSYTDRAFVGGVVGTPTEQKTYSGPGWTTILSGVWADRHLVTDNEESLQRGDFASNPHYMALLEDFDSSLNTGSYVWWDGIDTTAIAANPVDVRFQQRDDEAVTLATIDAIQGDMDAMFAILHDVDGAGHKVPAGSAKHLYGEAVAATDLKIGRMLDAITSRPTFEEEDWQVILTSDHGFAEVGGHCCLSWGIRHVPLIVSSQWVEQGTMIAAKGGQSLSTADVAPTVLDHFGAEIPSYFWGESRAGFKPVPEPSSLALLSVGLLAICRRRRR